MAVLPEKYVNKIKSRGYLQFYKGLLVRTFLYLKFAIPREYARLRGAKIGKNTIIPWKLAKKANANLIIGDDCIIETSDIDVRDQIEIGSHVIINRDVNIIRLSHFIDNNTEFTTRKYSPLIIESYCWLATGCKILPGTSHIQIGSVIGAYSIVFKNVSSMSVIGLNGVCMRKHNSVYSDLIVVSLKGGDLMSYVKARFCNEGC